MPRPGPRLPDGFGSQASSGQLIAYKYCDSRPEAVIKLLGRSGNRSVDRLPRLGQSQFAYGQRGLSQATQTNERAIYLSKALCKSNAGRANLLSQLAGLLRISCRIGVLGRTHPEAVVAVAFHVSISDSSSSLSSSFSYSPSTAPSLHTDLCCDQCLGLAEGARGKWTERGRARVRAGAGESGGAARSVIRLRSSAASSVVVLSPDLVELCLWLSARRGDQLLVRRSKVNKQSGPKKKTKEKKLCRVVVVVVDRPLSLSLSLSLSLCRARVAHSYCFTLFLNYSRYR